jgi:hypothetical protein
MDMENDPNDKDDKADFSEFRFTAAETETMSKDEENIFLLNTEVLDRQKP